MTSDFMEIVQLHERKWGDTQYPERPTLADIMKSQIVMVWRIDKRFIFSIHQSGDEANALVLRTITGQVDDNRKLEQIFVNQEPIKFGVRITSESNHEKPKEKTKPGKKAQALKRDDVLFVPASVIRDDGKPQTIKRGDVVIRQVKEGDLLPGRNTPFLKSQDQKKTRKKP